jgi:hypothetical protein
LNGRNERAVPSTIPPDTIYIDDEVPEHPKAKVFDPLKHGFNPLRNIDRKKAREKAKSSVKYGCAM